MVQGILVKEALSKDLVNAGAKLISLLEKKGLEIKVALWLFDIESEFWKLILYPKRYDSNDTFEMYKLALGCLEELNADNEEIILLKDVVITSKRNQYIASILKFIKGSKVKLGNNRLNKTYIEGTYFEDGFLYKAEA